MPYEKSGMPFFSILNNENIGIDLFFFPLALARTDLPVPSPGKSSAARGSGAGNKSFFSHEAPVQGTFPSTCDAHRQTQGGWSSRFTHAKGTQSRGSSAVPVRPQTQEKTTAVLAVRGYTLKRILLTKSWSFYFVKQRMNFRSHMSPAVPGFTHELGAHLCSLTGLFRAVLTRSRVCLSARPLLLTVHGGLTRMEG